MVCELYCSWKWDRYRKAGRHRKHLHPTSGSTWNTRYSITGAYLYNTTTQPYAAFVQYGYVAKDYLVYAEKF